MISSRERLGWALRRSRAAAWPTGSGSAAAAPLGRDGEMAELAAAGMKYLAIRLPADDVRRGFAAALSEPQKEK